MGYIHLGIFLCFQAILHLHTAVGSPSPRQNDIFMMEFFRKNGNQTKDMAALNRCRLFLQVIALSDIVSTNGKYILPQIKSNDLPTHRTSNLQWPFQANPSATDWAVWQYQLAFLESNGQLIKPLGQWNSNLHQQWHYKIDPSSNIVFFDDGTTAKQYQPISTLVGRNLRSGLWNDIGIYPNPSE